MNFRTLSNYLEDFVFLGVLALALWAGINWPLYIWAALALVAGVMYSVGSVPLAMMRIKRLDPLPPLTPYYFLVLNIASTVTLGVFGYTWCAIAVGMATAARFNVDLIEKNFRASMIRVNDIMKAVAAKAPDTKPVPPAVQSLTNGLV